MNITDHKYTPVNGLCVHPVKKPSGRIAPCNAKGVAHRKF